MTTFHRAGLIKLPTKSLDPTVILQLKSYLLQIDCFTIRIYQFNWRYGRQ